jgi:hypothetical protein
MELGKHFLDLPVNMFIATDPHLAVDIWKYRRAAGLADRTYIYSIRLEDSPFYHYHSVIEQAYVNGKFPHGLSINKDTALYVIVGWTRYWLMKQAVKLNPFDSKGVVWADYGLFHLYPGRIKPIQEQFLQILKHYPDNKIKFMVLQDTIRSEITDRVIYYSQRRCKLAAGLCGGPIHMINWLANEFEVEVEVCMQHGHPSLDEIIFSIIYANHPNAFSTYYGYYVDILPNHIGYKSGIKIILHNIDHCRVHRVNHPILKMCYYVLTAIQSGVIVAPLEYIRLIKALIGASDGELAKSAVQLMNKIIASHPEIGLRSDL